MSQHTSSPRLSYTSVLLRPPAPDTCSRPCTTHPCPTGFRIVRTMALNLSPGRKRRNSSSGSIQSRTRRPPPAARYPDSSHHDPGICVMTRETMPPPRRERERKKRRRERIRSTSPSPPRPSPGRTPSSQAPHSGPLSPGRRGGGASHQGGHRFHVGGDVVSVFPVVSSPVSQGHDHRQREQYFQPANDDVPPAP